MSFIAFGSLASATNIFVNGGFETGDLTGWNLSVQSGSDGNVTVQSGTTGPISGSPTVGPSSGSFYALSDQDGAGAYALTQSFTVDPGASVTLSFDLFVNDYAGVTDVGALDYTIEPTQFVTVDLLTATADPFSTAPADVIQNFYSGTDGGANPNPYTSYSFNISSLVSAGGTFQLRFGEADNQSFLNMGVDNVSVDEVATPEPATFLLIAPALAGLIALRRRASRA